MNIEHIAIWTNDLETLKEFYIKYFNASANQKYFNPVKKFSSYFLTFASGARLEIMQMPSICEKAKTDNDSHEQFLGLIHLAFSVGSQQEVDRLTEQLVNDGFTKLDGPRTTGDGYYESCILDPDGNRLEITT